MHLYVAPQTSDFQSALRKASFNLPPGDFKGAQTS